MTTIDEKIKALPPYAKQEVIDFIDFIVERYGKDSPVDEKDYWFKLSERSVDKIWNNDEDDIYNELLKK